MAQRPIFIPQTEGDTLVVTKSIDFDWVRGMAFSQKQKCMDSLHRSASNVEEIENILEVSSKSREPLGVQLSAFNLKIANTDTGRPLSVECAFQGSKVFDSGGPYTDIYKMSSRDAKQDQRLRNSGHLKSFEFFGKSWPINPQTAFYDWLYICALKKMPKSFLETLKNYDAFTDIEFNPKKSINCQAYSVALFVSMESRGLLSDAKISQSAFIAYLRPFRLSNAKQDNRGQEELF